MAVASLVLGILGLFTLGLTALVGLVLGIVAQVRISGSRGRLSGSGTATAGIVVSAVALALVPVIAILAGMLLPALSSAKNKSQSIMCMNNMKQLALGLLMYAGDNNDQLPQGANWCDAIQPYLGGGQALKCFSGDPSQRAHYAFNANLAGMKLSKIQSPAQTVLVFEIEGGWNVSGGPETLLKQPRHGGAVGLAFADGHSEIAMPQRLQTMRWEP
jgi:prepilin-type processing-associated H-X9-DG protein